MNGRRSGCRSTGTDDFRITGGGPLGQFDHVVVIRTWAMHMGACPLPEWSDPPPEAIKGDTLQLVRADPPLTTVLDASIDPLPVVDGSEHCAAWAAGQKQVVRDLDDGDVLEFDVPGWALWLDDPA